ncbi:MAG: type II toxin-antitoxin system HigB family toxin [Opitutaceae bacterium]|nr:type II toxin-antitoxin system HigB family toxin [Cytophagales bacterium]
MSYNVIAWALLAFYCTKHPEVQEHIIDWFKTIEKADWKNFYELKKDFPSCSLIGDDRVVFNIKENSYRIIVRFSFNYKRVMVKFFGTHAEYDKVNAKTIEPII